MCVVQGVFGDWIICTADVPVIPFGSSTQIIQRLLIEQLLVSHKIVKGNIGSMPTSSILPSALTDLLFFFNFFILRDI